MEAIQILAKCVDLLFYSKELIFFLHLLSGYWWIAIFWTYQNALCLKSKYSYKPLLQPYEPLLKLPVVFLHLIKLSHDLLFSYFILYASLLLTLSPYKIFCILVLHRIFKTSISSLFPSYWFMIQSCYPCRTTVFKRIL